MTTNTPARTITVHVPLTFTRRGGRKFVRIEGSILPYSPRSEIHAAAKALARAYRWRRKIEDGDYASITELARAEKVNQSYACRFLRLTLLAPDIGEAILNGSLPPEFTLKELTKRMPASWPEQAKRLRT